ncbi:hypothetical protein TruAng_001343 [Truncatella angustata]|nr:hypothetical protein TruAng_001343 [Truncatella angustata]
MTTIISVVSTTIVASPSSQVTWVLPITGSFGRWSSHSPWGPIITSGAGPSTSQGEEVTTRSQASANGEQTIPAGASATTFAVAIETTVSKDGSAVVVTITSTSTRILDASTTLPLTTTFFPPSFCSGRYYTNIYTQTPEISSGGYDRLYGTCWPFLTNTLSPGMCAGFMTSVSVLLHEGVYTDICCQSGFLWDFRGCSSLVSLATDVLVAPAVTSADTLTRVSSVVATHMAIAMLWRTEDLSLFPDDVSSRRRALQAQASSVMSNYNNEGSSTNVTGAPSANATGTTSTNATGAPSGLSLEARIAVTAWVWKVRRRRRTDLWAPDGNAQELDASSSIWKRYLGGKWRAEMHPERQTAELPAHDKPAELDHNRQSMTHSPVELPGSNQWHEITIGTAGAGERDDHEGLAQVKMPSVT